MRSIFVSFCCQFILARCGTYRMLEFTWESFHDESLNSACPPCSIVLSLASCHKIQSYFWCKESQQHEDSPFSRTVLLSIWDSVGEPIVEINLHPLIWITGNAWSFVTGEEGNQSTPKRAEVLLHGGGHISRDILQDYVPLQPKPGICQQKCRYDSINNPWHCVFPNWCHYTTGGWQHSPTPSSYPWGPGSHKALST